MVKADAYVLKKHVTSTFKDETDLTSSWWGGKLIVSKKMGNL
jgi:hypothetical protein